MGILFLSARRDVSQASPTRDRLGYMTITSRSHLGVTAPDTLGARLLTSAWAGVA